MKPTFHVVRTMDTAEMIAEQITEMIEQGVLSPGDRLPSEAELVAQLGVGRSSVREAKRVLAAKGIIEGQAGRGTYVAQRDPAAPHTGEPRPIGPATFLAQESAADLLVVRQLLEAQIVELAVRHATETDLANMAATLARMAAATSPQQAALDGVEFQTQLATATHNHALARLYGAVVEMLARKMPAAAQERSDLQEETRELRALYDFVRRRERKKARRLLRSRAARIGLLTGPLASGDSEE
jgi:DNA-binding FadR family transcriptional regulator